jgi:Tfp pilus assembly protein PilF
MRNLNILLLIFLLFISSSVWSQEVNTDSLLNEASKELENHELNLSHQNLDDIINEDSENARAYLLRAKVLIEEGEREEALKDLTNCINITEDIAEAYVLRARLYSQLGYHRDYSIIDIDRAIMIDKLNSSN